MEAIWVTELIGLAKAAFWPVVVLVLAKVFGPSV